MAFNLVKLTEFRLLNYFFHTCKLDHYNQLKRVGFTSIRICLKALIYFKPDYQTFICVLLGPTSLHAWNVRVLEQVRIIYCRNFCRQSSHFCWELFQQMSCCHRVWINFSLPFVGPACLYISTTTFSCCRTNSFRAGDFVLLIFWLGSCWREWYHLTI